MIFARILELYSDATQSWYHDLFPIAHKLFVLLATIEVLWVACKLALEQEELTAATGRLLLNVMGISFFYALLLHSNTWIPDIIDGFVYAGEKAAHTGALNPSSVIDLGVSIAKNLYSTLGVWGTFRDPAIFFATALAVISILIAFSVIAAIMLKTLISMYFSLGAGILFLGFGGSRWTRSLAEKFLMYVVSVGVRLFVLYLVIGVGQKVFHLWALALSSGQETTDVSLCFLGIVLSIVYGVSAWTIPNEAADMASGAISFTAHEGERMVASAIPAGIAGGQALGGAASFVSQAAAGPMGALAAATRAGGQKLASVFGGQGGGGTGGSPGGGAGAASGSSAGLSQFRNAGQAAKSGAGSAGAQQPDLSGVKDTKVRESLEKFSKLGGKS